MMLDDAFAAVSSQHGKATTRLGHFIGHKVNAQIEYGIKHKLYNEKALTAIGIGISAPIVVASTAGSIAISASTKGVATPLALAGLAAGTWAANQVADAVTGLIRNQFRKKRMRRWLDDHPQVRTSMEGAGAKLLLIQDTCDSIRRAIDHYSKACEAAAKLRDEIVNSKQCNFTNCSELTTTVKRLMKFLHEVEKTERYLLPALDLSIYLKNTQKALCDMWRARASIYLESIGQHIHTGSHNEKLCSACCYQPAMAGVPKPRRRAKVGGSVPSANFIADYGKQSETLEVELEALIRLREHFSTDLQAVPNAGGSEPNSHARTRFERLVSDAAQYYNNPGIAKRTVHYVANHYTRRTKGEIFMDGLNRSAALVTGVATAAVPSAVNVGVVTPFITQPLVDSLSKTGVNSLGSVAVNAVAGIPGTMIGKGISLTTKAGIGGATFVTGLVVPRIDGTSSVAQMPDDVEDGDLKKQGKIAGDMLFKKAVRHLKQASDAFEKVCKEHTLQSCNDTFNLAQQIGEFVWHLEKSIRYLNQATAVVSHISARLMDWNELEAQSWESVRRASMHYLSWSCMGCECQNSRHPNPFSACYGPGKVPSEPKRRMTNL